MKKLALIAALLLASPVAAQSLQQPLGAGGQTNTSQLPNTGVICEEEITATFCNVPTSPSHGGYGIEAAGRGRSRRLAPRRSHAVHSALLGIPAGQRIVQLTQYCGRTSMVGASNCWLGRGLRLWIRDGLACEKLRASGVATVRPQLRRIAIEFFRDIFAGH